MAIRYAVANGNWSNVATWDGGTTLPGAGDDVYADGKTVTIDQNITVNSINSTQRSGGTNGGYFTPNSSCANITANIISGLTTCLVSTISGSLTINGNITGGTNNNSNGFTHNNTGLGTITINGNISGAIGGLNGVGVSFNGNHLYVNGNITSGALIYNGYGLSITGGSCSVVGDIIAAAGNNTSNFGIYITTTGTVDITGDLYSGNYQNNYALYLASSATVNVTGNLITNQVPAIYSAGSGIINVLNDITVLGTNTQIYNASTGTINVVGNLYGSVSATPSTRHIIYNASTGNINITGDIIMYDVGTSQNGLIYNVGAGKVTVTGNLVAGTVADTWCIRNASTGEINITGNVTAGSNATAYGIYSVTNGIIDIAGEIIGSSDAPAIYSTGASSVVILRGNISGIAYKLPFYTAITSLVKLSSSGEQSITMQDVLGGNRVLSTSNTSNGCPAEDDVRFGVTFGSTLEYTGTCKVPTADKVLLGADVDNTVGTLLMSPEDFWNYAQANITAGIGARLKNCATVETVGEQIVSLNQQ